MRRAGLIAVTVIIVLAGLVAFAAFFSSRDDAGIATSTAPGEPAPEQTARTLRQGNVVLSFADPAQRPALRALAEEISGPSDPALVHAGQAVIVQRDPDAAGVEAFAFERRLRAGGPEDPQLRRFVEHFLGRGDGTRNG